MELKNSPGEFLQSIAGPMNIKFLKYWDECSSCLTIALFLILDTRWILSNIIMISCMARISLTNVYKKYEQLFFNLYIDHGGRVISSKIIIGDSE